MAWFNYGYHWRMASFRNRWWGHIEDPPVDPLAGLGVLRKLGSSDLLRVTGGLGTGLSCCCTSKTGLCLGPSYPIRAPRVISVSVLTVAGAQPRAVAGRCEAFPDLGLAVPAKGCAFGAPTAFCGKCSDRCAVINGTWEVWDDADCDNDWGSQQCVNNLSWCFCPGGCNSYANGGVTIGIGYIADPGTGNPCWYASIEIIDYCASSPAGPFVRRYFYSAFYRSAPLTFSSGKWDSIGSFSLPMYGVGYDSANGSSVGNPCTPPASITVNAS
jgi:hypothetical protein